MFKSHASSLTLPPSFAGLVVAVVFGYWPSAFAQSPPQNSLWNGGTFNWTEAARWTPAGVPNNTANATYNAEISAAGSNVRLTQAITLESLTWSRGTISRLGASAFTLTANRGVSLVGSDLKTLNGNRLVTLGDSTWTNSGNCTLTTAHFENRGQLDLWSDADLTGSGSFVNGTGATFRKRAGTDVTSIGVHPNFPATNSGTVEIQSGTILWGGSAVHDGAFLVSSGASLRFGRGTNRLEGPGKLQLPVGATLVVRDTPTALELNPTTPLELEGRLEVAAGARVTVGASTHLGELALDSGTLEGVGSVQVSRQFDWGASTLGGSGALSFNAGAQIHLSPIAVTRIVNQRTLEFDNDVDWGAVTLTLGGDANLILRSTFVLQSGAQFSAASGQSAHIRNEGLLAQRRGGIAATTQIGIASGGRVTFDNRGRVEVDTNILMMAFGGNHSGTFHVGSQATLVLGGHDASQSRFEPGAVLDLPSADSRLELRAGDFDFDSGQTATVAGQLQMSGARVVVRGGTRLVFGQWQSSGGGNSVELAGGEMGATGLASLTGSLTGRGQVIGNPVCPNLRVAPGDLLNPTGRLTFDGQPSFGASTVLAVELGGTTPATDFDQIVATGVARLNNARLQVTFLRNFQETVAPTDRFVVLRALGWVGALAELPNPANGARVYTEDGYGSFEVQYSETEITLTDYRPERAPGELEAWEPFDYAVTTPPAPPATLVSKAGGNGFVGVWTSNSGLTTEYQLAADSLPHALLARWGNHVALTSPRSSFSLIQRRLAYRLGAPGTTRYVSFLIRPVSPVTATSFFGLLFQRSTTGVGTVPPNLFVGKPARGATDHWVVEEAGGTGQQPASGAALIAEDTYLCVVKLEFATGADRISLFVNPSPAQPEPALAAAVKTDFDIGVITSLALNSSGSWEFDELRVANTWAAALRDVNFRPPLAIEPIPDVVLTEQRPFDFTPHLVESVAPRTVQWDLLSHPAGLTIDASAGRMRWTPQETDGQPAGGPGVEVVVRARDFPEPSSTATYRFVIQVREANSVPAIDVGSLGSNEVAPGESIHRTLRSIDPDLPANTHTYTLVSGPVGMTVSPSGVLDWTPPLDQAVGPVNFTVEVEDFNADASVDPHLRSRAVFTFNVIPRTDLKLSLVASPSGPLVAGQRGQYELRVENLGPEAATDVELRFNSSVPFLPPVQGLTITDSASSPSIRPPQADGDEWVFYLGTLARGATATARLEMVFSWVQLYALSWAVRSTAAELNGADNQLALGVSVGAIPLENPDEWQFALLDEEGLTGSEVVMEIDPTDGQPALAWFSLDTRRHKLKYAKHRGLGWETTVVQEFTHTERVGERGGLAMQVTPLGPRFAYILTPASGRPQIRYLTWPDRRTSAQETVYEASRPLGSLQFTGSPLTPPLLWFTEETRLVQAELSASSAGGWLSASYPLPDGSVVYPQGRPFSLLRGVDLVGQHLGYLILQRADRSLDLVEALVPAANGGRFEPIVSLPRTQLPLYVSSLHAAGTTHLAYTTPNAAFTAPDGDSYRLSIAHAEKTAGTWDFDGALPAPAGTTGSCTRPVLVRDASGAIQLVFVCKSETADQAALGIPDGSDREYRRSWHVAQRRGSDWSSEELYAATDRVSGLTAAELRQPVRQPDDPALGAAFDRQGVLMIAAHTGWPNENLVFGSRSPRWQEFPVADLTSESLHRPAIGLNRADRPSVVWNEVRETGSYQLNYAFLLEGNVGAAFSAGPSTNLAGLQGSVGLDLDPSDGLHVLARGPSETGGLLSRSLGAGDTAWLENLVSNDPPNDLLEPGQVSLADGLVAVTSDATFRPKLFSLGWSQNQWVPLGPNTVSPGQIAPVRRRLTATDEALAPPAVCVAYVPGRPNGDLTPFEVRVATFREGVWTDELVTTVAGPTPPLLDVKWLWHPPFQPSNRGYLYVAITGPPDAESRTSLHLLRRDLNRTVGPWIDTLLEQAAPDYTRAVRLEGRRESVRLGYIGSSGRLFLAQADQALDLNQVRRAKVERVPIQGTVDEFDLVAEPGGTWLTVAHDHKLAAIGMGPFASFGGEELFPFVPQSPTPDTDASGLDTYGNSSCLLFVARLIRELSGVRDREDSSSSSNRDSDELPSSPIGDAPTRPVRVASGSPRIGQPDPLTVPNTALFYAIRDRMNGTAEGRRLVELYYRLEIAARVVVWKHPALAMRLAFLLGNFTPCLREWHEGRGANAVLTPGMIEELSALWRSLAALGSPELKAALEAEYVRFNRFEDFVDRNMDEWAAKLGLASTAPVLVFQLVSAQLTDTGFSALVEPPTVATYRLERSTSLSPGAWTPVPNAKSSLEGGRLRLIDPAPPSTSTFYRVARVSAVHSSGGPNRD